MRKAERVDHVWELIKSHMAEEDIQKVEKEEVVWANWTVEKRLAWWYGVLDCFTIESLKKIERYAREGKWNSVVYAMRNPFSFQVFGEEI